MAVKRFQQEVAAASALRHPNLVTIHKLDRTAESLPYIVMDYLDGESLADLLKRRGRLDITTTLKLTKQVLDGLVYAHSKGVVHRDLKPSNIILTQTPSGQERVVLVDFGIAKFLPSVQEQTQNLTQSGEIFGSPNYMSPEQCRGSSVDGRSDIYSLGCVMYECLDGVPPFAGENVVQTILGHLLQAPNNLSAALDSPICGTVNDLIRLSFVWLKIPNSATAQPAH